MGIIVLISLCLIECNYSPSATTTSGEELERSFLNPPLTTRPGVLWQWMGGLISREGITKDLEAMAEQGIGGVIVMQMPDQAPYPQRWDFRDYPGKIEVLSDEWYEIVNYAVGEADRLNLTFSMFLCPGWSHAGGPWVTPDKGLKKLVSGEIEVKGPSHCNEILPKAPRSAGIGGGNEIPSWFSLKDEQKKDVSSDFYKEIAVIALPVVGDNMAIPPDGIIDISPFMDAEGRLKWEVPEGSWKIVRLGVAAENGVNHPAPLEATGLECDRMDQEAVQQVFDGMIGRIIGEAKAKGYTAFKAFETDSYEGGFQDFSPDFQEQFLKRRGYDCTPWLPVWLNRHLPGSVIGSEDLTKRFISDMTRTISELTAERFNGELQNLADENSVEWITEPYFFLNVDWRMLGAESNMPGSEFWVGKPFSMIGPAPDIAALYGLQVVWAESFTAESFNSAWRNTPYELKPWGDAAFSRGVNQLYMHGFVHNPFGDHIQPGLTMGYWGTQLNRHLTWWPYAAPWHRYLARCQFMLQQGRPVNDVLVYPGRIGWIPSDEVQAGPFHQVVLDDVALMERISVREDGRIEVQGGGDFAAITLTPGLAIRPESLRKIRELVLAGATLIGEAPPGESSSLENYPECDREIADLTDELWNGEGDGELHELSFGKGRILATAELIEALNRITGGPDLQFIGESGKGHTDLFRKEPEYAPDESLLPLPGVQVNAISDEAFSSMDFTHRRDGDVDIYFVCNTGDDAIELIGDFRVDGRRPEVWDPVTGQIKDNPVWQREEGRTKVAMQFAPRQSFFVVFRTPANRSSSGTFETSGTFKKQTANADVIKQLDGPWRVTFDQKWGGTAEAIVLDELEDWTRLNNRAINYYSGSAVYQKSFDVSTVPSGVSYLDVGEVYNLARVTLNDTELGVIWTAPWRLQIPAGILKTKSNSLKIEVVNTWVNRLIGDEQEPEDCPLVEWSPANRKGSYDINVNSRGLKDLPDWVVHSDERPSKGRYTFTSWRFYDKNAPLQPAGLLGPVQLLSE